MDLIPSLSALAHPGAGLSELMVMPVTLHAGRAIAAQQCAEKVSLWMERRRQLPLSIDLISDTSDLHSHPALSVLQESMKYWERLLVDMPSSALQCFSGHDLPLLREVFIAQYVASGNDTNAAILSSAPRLHKVVLSIPTSPLFQLSSLPLDQMTVAHFHGPFDENRALQLSQMAMLRFLAMTVDETLRDLVNDIYLPNLYELAIHEGETAKPGALQEVFEHLDAPHLVSLKLHFLQVTENRLLRAQII
ncbi:hypothetical protein BDZ89DRAFT_1147518 [Hymenopellis radicata]|nr:hypothetical protein BDZ89DRAFT_1147518 [Hymenopellis radicata]